MLCNSKGRGTQLDRHSRRATCTTGRHARELQICSNLTERHQCQTHTTPILPRRWARSLGLYERLADALVEPIREEVKAKASAAASAGELAFIRHLGQHGGAADFRVLLSSAFEGVCEAMHAGAVVLTQGDASVQELSDRFVSHAELQYGSLKSFHVGMAGMLGPPNPNVLDAIEREHLDGPDTDIKQKTHNYGIETSPRIEYYFVVDPERGRAKLGLETYPAEPNVALRKQRIERPLESFDGAVADLNLRLNREGQSPLSKAELIALRLYTGPMCASAEHRTTASLARLPRSAPPCALSGTCGTTPSAAPRGQATR